MKSIKNILIFVSVIITDYCSGQDTLSVLFLGNSYTYYNNLPQLVKDISGSAGKTLLIDANTPGGYTIYDHLTNAASISKIRQGGWDYVVIQEQSQVPTIDYFRYNSMYPSLTELKDTIELYNPCAKLITYMTWGRRFGGQQCDGSGTYCSPNFVDFNHMQDSLKSAYLGISGLLNIQCAPVGEVWRNIFNDTSLVLHISDDSHPNLDGSYAAACAIFSSIWKRPASGLAYPAGMTPERAQYFQSISDSTVFTGPDEWNLFINNPSADFTSTVSGFSVQFTNLSESVTNDSIAFSWDFGDGSHSDSISPLHTYSSPGTYAVRLIAASCILSDTINKMVEVREPDPVIAGYIIYPNPAASFVSIKWAGNDSRDVLIYNSLGQRVKYISKLVSDASISIADLQSGVYFLRISNGQEKILRKLIVGK